MSWLFSQALAAEFSEVILPDGAQSAPLSVMPTPHKFWRNDRMMDASRLSQFGLMCAVLTEGDGEALLMSFLAASRARTYQQRELAPELTAGGPAYGEKWHELSMRYDPALSSWKTHQCLFPEALPWSSVTLPKWGMTRNGGVFQHPTLERPINGIVSGLWQTPVADDAVNRTQGKWNSRGEPKLSAQVKLWPTPRVSSVKGSGPSRVGHRTDLQTAVRKWPTPVASMSKGSSPAALTRRSKASRENDRLDHAVMASDGGQLNPPWVEWLMGWPIGWTELKPLEMGRFREWQDQHSIF